jgi:hypothetical protein
LENKYKYRVKVVQQQQICRDSYFTVVVRPRSEHELNARQPLATVLTNMASTNYYYNVTCSRFFTAKMNYDDVRGMHIQERMIGIMKEAIK